MNINLPFLTCDKDDVFAVGPLVGEHVGYYYFIVYLVGPREIRIYETDINRLDAKRKQLTDLLT